MYDEGLLGYWDEDLPGKVQYSRASWHCGQQWDPIRKEWVIVPTIVDHDHWRFAQHHDQVSDLVGGLEHGPVERLQRSVQDITAIATLNFAGISRSSSERCTAQTNYSIYSDID
jgi:hypothetical protein